jgi:hypothetical protein
MMHSLGGTPPGGRCTLHGRVVIAIAGGLILGSLAAGQKPPEKKPAAPAVAPASQLAEELARRMSGEMHVKTAVGAPVKVGSVTLIPIVMVEVNFGGGGVQQAGDAFFMGGQARPLGFVAITKKGTRFLSVAKAPAK